MGINNVNVEYLVVENEDSKGRNALPPAKVRAEGEHTEFNKTTEK